jgi:uncharacterized RDD family membrane protein YckC
MTRAPTRSTASTAGSTGTDVHVTGRRIVSTLIDVVALSGAYALVAAVTGSIHTAGPWNWVADTSPTASVLYALGVAAYFILMEVRFGQTVGKMLTGIRVIDERTGATPHFGAASIRTVLRLVDGLAGYLVAYAVVLTSGRRQRLGDMAAHTLVART